jgi:hypothetical protein
VSPLRYMFGSYNPDKDRIWGSMPLSALFILFDFVVQNPTHPETKSNLSLLGIAAGYFCRLEYASGGSLPSSLLSDFTHIARQYVQDSESKLKVGTAGAADVDRSSGQSIMVNLGPQSPPLSVFVSKPEAIYISRSKGRGSESNNLHRHTTMAMKRRQTLGA